MLVVRADAGRLGLGHVVRSFALTEAWVERTGRAVAVVKDVPGPFMDRFYAAGVEVMEAQGVSGSVEDAAHLINVCNEHSADWVAVDGYELDANFHRRVRSAGLRLLLIDDYGRTASREADCIVDQNLGATPDSYAHGDGPPTLLLGSRYALLRREFRSTSVERAFPPVASHVLVTLGGFPPHGLVDKALDAVGRLRSSVFGELKLATPGIGEPYIDEMSTVMAWADLALAGAGSTTWELCRMGVPSLIVVTADNQEPIAQEVDAAGAAVNLGWHENLSVGALAACLQELSGDAARRAAISARGRALVDGRGAMRVVAHLRSRLIRIRRVNADDERFLLELVNDPDARAASFSTTSIAPEEHHSWLASKLADPGCFAYIATLENGKILGQVRFDREGPLAWTGASLAPAGRSRGYGAPLILAGVARLFADSDVEEVHAAVKPSNARSARSFEDAGFSVHDGAVPGAEPALHYALRRGDTG